MRRLVLALAMLSLFCVAPEAWAQRQVAPYQPAKPAISPYMYLTLPDTGPLPNYQAYVEPIQNQQQINARQENQLRQLQQGQEDYAPARVAATGTGSVYNSMSHYYPSGAGGGQRGGGGQRQGANRTGQRRAPSPYQPAQAMGGAGMGGGFF